MKDCLVAIFEYLWEREAPRRWEVLWLWVMILLLTFAPGCATNEPPPVETFTPTEMRALLCEGGDTKIGGRSVNIEISSLPCTALKTRLAIEDSQGRGFWAGGVTRFFLRTRLVARGVFSTVFGMVGLG